MTEILKNNLEHLFEQGSFENLIEYIKNSTQEEKAEYSNLVPKAIKTSSKNYWDWSLSQNIRDAERKKIKALSVVLYANSSFTEIKKAGWLAIPDLEIIKTILEVFQPKWIDSWTNWVLDESPRRFDLIFPLVKEGYCRKPTSDNYVLGMIESINYERKTDQYLVDSIRVNIKNLKEDIWRIFEVEGGGEFSLAAHDKYSHEKNCWDNALRSLSEDSTLPRDRLLDSSLEALEKDFAQFRAGWYSRFFVSLEPSQEEIQSRVDKLILLMGSQIPPTVTFTLKNLQILEKKKLLEVDEFIENVEPTLNAKTKSTVILSLRILDSLAKRNKERQNQIAQVSIGAIIFDNADVQKIVFDLIDKYGNNGDERIVQYLTLNREFIFPSLRSKLEAWVAHEDLEPAEPESLYDEPNVMAINFQPEEITPIENLEELVEELSHVIEEPDEPIKIERVLDGVSRLCRDKTDNFNKLVGPLKKRAITLINRGPEKWLIFQLSRLALSVIERHNYFKADYKKHKKEKKADFESVFIVRLFFLVERLKSNPNNGVSLISMPTHGRGFINPSIIPERIKLNTKNKELENSLDCALAILRLDRTIVNESKSEEIIQELINIKTEFALACAYALGAEVKIGKESALWIAASRIRLPEENDQKTIDKFGLLGPDTGYSAKYLPWVKVKKSENYSFYDLKVDRVPEVYRSIPNEHLSVMFHGEGLGSFKQSHFGFTSGLVRWGSTIWPSNLEPYFCCGACEVDITWAEAQWHVQSFFLPLLEPDVPLKSMALLLLIAGLSSKEPGQRGIAIDIVIMSIEDGRMDISLLGDIMAMLITTGIIIVPRWTKAIKEIAAISSRHAEAMKSLIQSILQFDPEDSPRELGGLIELLYELQVTSNKGIDDKRAIKFFKANKKSGKQGTFSKKLLALANG